MNMRMKYVLHSKAVGNCFILSFNLWTPGDSSSCFLTKWVIQTTMVLPRAFTELTVPLDLYSLHIFSCYLRQITASLDPKVLLLRATSFSNSNFKMTLCNFKNCMSNNLAKISNLVLFQNFKPNLSCYLRDMPVPPTSTRLLYFHQWHSILKTHQVRKNVLFFTFTLLLPVSHLEYFLRCLLVLNVLCIFRCLLRNSSRLL